MAVLKPSGLTRAGAAHASVTMLALLVFAAISSAEGSTGCSSGIDVTKAPYRADPTGATDSSSAFNAAIVAAGGGGMAVHTRYCYEHTAFPVVSTKRV